MVYAMTSEEAPNGKELSEEQIIQKIHEFADLLTGGPLGCSQPLWLPTHFFHDAETDDILCWLILEHLHRRAGTHLTTMVQLPVRDQAEDAQVIDTVEDYFKKAPGNVKIVRDSTSRNFDA